MSYLHKEKHQIHRGIKPDNISMNADGVVKLSDFDISQRFEKNQNYSKIFLGPRSYINREIITSKIYSYSRDNSNEGFVIYELVIGVEHYGSEIIF